MAVPVIRVDRLVAGYGDRIVLEDISFAIARGEIFGIVGGSGCGKTTLMRHLIGLQVPRAGTVLVEGENIGAADEDELRRIQRTIGVAYQSGALFASLTLGENVALALEEYTTLPPTLIRRLVRIKLSMVKLGGCEDLPIQELSGGMKKRAGLARAMALDPRILFFDEPSAGLDPVTSAELDEVILQINRSLGTTIVVVTHELPSIFRIAERVIMLDGPSRSIIAEGRPHELREHSRDPRVHAFFNRLPGASVRMEESHGYRGA
jgi:phospholipid/cholesterol/gamma-HCH transport system ATP-binding protein